MQNLTVYSEIAKILPESTFRSLVMALKQDELVYQALADSTVRAKAIQQFGADLNEWSPANITFLLLGLPIRNRQNGPLEIEEEEIKTDAINAYNTFVRVSKRPYSLIEAGRIALGIVIRQQNGVTWQSLLQDIVARTGDRNGRLFPIWSTILSCVYGMVDKPSEFLKSLFGRRVNPLASALTCHILLAQPATEGQHADRLRDLMAAIPNYSHVPLLRMVSVNAYHNLAAIVARDLLNNNQPTTAILSNKRGFDEIDQENMLAWALETQRLAGLFQLARQPANAKAFILRTQNAVRQWEAGLQIQLANLSMEENQPDQAILSIVNAQKNASNSLLIQREAVLSLGSQFRCSEAPASLLDQPYPLAQLLQSICNAETGEIEAAREMARTAVDDWESLIKLDPIGSLPLIGINWNPIEFMQILKDLGLSNEALRFGRTSVQTRWADRVLLDYVNDLEIQTRDFTSALDTTLLLLAYEPNQPEYLRRLATIYQLLGDDQNGAQVLSRIVENHQPISEADWIYMAKAAAKAEDWDKVIACAEKVLAESPDCGEAIGLKGLARKGQSAPEEAILNLAKATLLAPEIEWLWLNLVDVYEELSDPDKAQETLRVGVLAVPDSWQIHYRLAKYALNYGGVTAAIQDLSEAYQLNPKVEDLATTYGKSLLEIGRISEAKNVLLNAINNWPNSSEISYMLGQTFIATGDLKSALSYLEQCTHGENVPEDWLLEYADTLVQYDRQLVNSGQFGMVDLKSAEASINKILLNSPDSFQARLLKAELLSLNGTPGESYDIFKQLIDTPQGKLSLWRSRILSGSAKTAMQLGHYETAIALLTEASQSNSEDLETRMLLVDALKSGHLYQEAMQSARQILDLAPDSLQILNWFANQASDLGEYSEAARALECAYQFAPDDPEQISKLAAVKVKMGLPDEARRLMRSILRLANVTSDQLQKVASISAEIGDKDGSLEFLQTALQTSSGKSPTLQLKIAYLHQIRCEYEIALNVVQDLLHQFPEDKSLYAFEADILAAQNHPQAAIACLEHLTSLAGEFMNSSKIDWNTLESDPVFQKGWIASLQIEEAIDLRFAWLFRRCGNLTSSLQHAQKVLDKFPSDTSLHYLITDLKFGMLQSGSSKEDSTLPDLAGPWFSLSNGQQPSLSIQTSMVAQLIALKVEKSLEDGNDNIAQDLLEEGLKLSPEDPRLGACRVRLLSRQGEIRTAQMLYADLRQHLSDWKPEISGWNQSALPINIVHPEVELISMQLWKADVALEARAWQDARSEYTKLMVNYKDEPIAHLHFARCIVITGEAQSLCQEVHCTRHAPGEQSVSQQAESDFNQEIQYLESSLPENQTLRWKSRGKVLFAPSPVELRQLANFLPGSGEAAALIRSLRSISKVPDAIRIGQELPENAEVQVQLALCYHKYDPQKGLEAAWRAVEETPSDPICHAVLCQVAESAGQLSIALDAVESALKIWPDEPEWQAIAAKLAERLENNDKAIKHWEDCLSLNPGNVDYSLFAAKTHFDSGHAVRAAEILEKAVRLDASRADLWLNLAKAKFVNGYVRDAMNFAEQASKLSPGWVDPEILRGEIALANNNLADAMEFAHSAIARDGKDNDAILFLAKVNRLNGKPGESLRVIEAAMAYSADPLPLQIMRAQLIGEAKGVKAQLPILLEIVKENPTYVPGLTMLAESQTENGDWKGALASAQEALRLDPDRTNLKLMVGRMQLNAGQLDQAVHYLSEVIKDNPKDIEAYLELAKTYLARRQDSDALQLFRQAIHLSPMDHRAYYQAALILRDNKDYVGAESMLRRAAELAPDDINIRRQLGAVIALNLVYNSQEVSVAYENKSQH